MSDEKKNPVLKCGFAAAGTYGHECGKPSTVVFVKKSERTVSGEFFVGRCDECAMIRGGENRNVIRRESVHGQTNEWKGY